jgi:hypothetical protein
VYLLHCCGDLIFVPTNDEIMRTKLPLRQNENGQISISSFFCHGKRVLVQFDGLISEFDELLDFLFASKEMYFVERYSTHDLKFCSDQFFLSRSNRY